MSNISENNILYELLIHAEWPQDSEVQGRGSEKYEEKFGIGSLWSWLGPLAPAIWPPAIYQRLQNLQMSWHFAVGGDGKVIAVFQDQFLEIRSSRDEYGSIIGQVRVGYDPYPQWRKILWSPDCTMLALSDSSGNVEFYDLIGALLFTISRSTGKEVNTKKDISAAAAGMFFSDARIKNTLWSYEFIVTNYKGILDGYFVSPTEGHQESHSFSFSSFYPHGVTAVCYQHSHKLLLVSGVSYKFQNSSKLNHASEKGISAWRILSGQPYYKLSLSYADEVLVCKKNWKLNIPFYGQIGTSKQDTVYKMSVSPEENILAAIHISGALSLWDLPSLNLKKMWELQLQPNYSDINPALCELGMKRKAAILLSDPLQFNLIDVNWWSNEAVILVRYCGAVTVSSVHSLKNLLGISPEWFEPSVQVSSFCDRGFLAMECETFVTKKKTSANDSMDTSDDESSDDDDDVSVFTYTAGMAKRILFFITDSERFQPPRKKMKFLNKTYRLLCLKSTTPEELYVRKINNEEYGEALVLAKTYHLDCDLVYQRQWRKTPASVATIQDYLSKITKRSWVLHECLERVPESIEAAKELLMYGLRGTDLAALIAIGNGEDHGRFIVGELGDDEVFEEFDEAYLISSEEMERRKKLSQRKRNELIKQIDFSNLTLEQKQLCDCRLRLLMYLDRLATYEAVLGGPLVAEELFDHNFFKKFRMQSGLEVAIGFARDSNWRAVAAMFTYHTNETLPHRLTVLSNFPESTSPMEYHSLLPKLQYKKESLVVHRWNEDKWRESDWCEMKYSKSCLLPASEDFVNDFYEEHKDLAKYKQKLTVSLITEWFCERAHEIECRSGLVDNALDLVKLGIEKNVPGLEVLCDNLMTLETLTYECELEKTISLKMLEGMSNFEKTLLLMSASSDENFIKHVKQWLLPFLHRCEKREMGAQNRLMREYLIFLSKDSLSYCRKIFENSRHDQPDPIVPGVINQISLALDCIYVCESVNCLKDVCVILEHLPQKSNRHPDVQLAELYDRMTELEKHVRVAELLEKNANSVTLRYIKNCCKHDEEVRKLLTKLTRSAGRRSPALSESEWRNLLFDVLEMQSILFHFVSVQECYEIYLQSLLCSGKQETISFAGRMMECSAKKDKKMAALQQNEHFTYRLPYSSSVDLILKASQEYFNSSATSSDPYMSLAWYCLNMIEDIHPSIEEEKDLISSLKLLREFNVKVLPLQVRLSSDRLCFIKQTLKSKAKAYRSSQKLLNLAHLLRIFGNDNQKREGHVLSVIAEDAFNEVDYEACFNICKQLMEGGFKEGWFICYALGECIDFKDIDAKCELLSFSLIHCSSDLIEVIVKSICDLRLQVICKRVTFLMGDNFLLKNLKEANGQLDKEAENSDSSAVDESRTFWQAGEKTMQVLQNSTKTTKSVLTSVGSTQFWKDTMKWIQHSTWKSIDYEDDDDDEQTNKNINMQAVCAFYSGLIENVHISKLEANYQRYVRPDPKQPVEIKLSVLRASLLEDTLKAECEKSSVSPSVLLDLAKIYLPEDIQFCLSLLLTLKKAEDAEEFFSKLPSTAVVLQFASLFYAIRISTLLDEASLFSENAEFSLDPTNIIHKVDGFLNSEGNNLLNFDSEIQKCFELLRKYNQMLYDFVQAELLHSIGGGVDAARFTEDDVYKKETILGIAMTIDDSIFHIAISLASHYKLSLWDVYMTHLEFLFAENKISSVVIEERIKKLKLLEVLLKEQKSFQEKLQNCIFPNIDGKDHERLALYFSLLESCGDNPNEVGVKPSVHKKLLAKLHSAVKGLDYKMLMKPRSCPVPYISSLLNESNVHVFAKMASKIPNEDGGFLYPGIIYCVWLKKYFFEGSGSNSKIPRTFSEWIHRYESCHDTLQRLTAPDILDFITYILFTRKSLDKLTVECRVELVKRAIKFCKQKNVKIKDDVDGSQWNSVLNTLQQYYQHLQRMGDELLVELRNSDDVKIKDYVEEFDLTQSDTEKLRYFLAKIVIDGSDISLLKTFLACSPTTIEWQPCDAYIEAVNLVLTFVKCPESLPLLCIEQTEYIEVLNRILKTISENKDELMIEDMVLEILQTFCHDTKVPVSTRLNILELLEKTSCLSDDYNDLLLLYRTQTVVSTTWPDFEVLEDNVKNEVQRKTLFEKLTEMSSKVDQFIAVSEILYHWPSFCSVIHENPETEPWTIVLCKLAALPKKEGLDKAVQVFNKASAKFPMSEQVCLKIFEEICKQGSLLHSLKFAFKTNFSNIHTLGIEMLKQSSEFTTTDVDDELLELALQRHLTPAVVNTKLYPYLIKFLIRKQEEARKEKDYLSVETVVKELVSAGFTAEAGSLLFILSKTHLGLSTFSSAFHFLNQWLLETEP